MKEQESDDLYDQLRRKVEGYGTNPPDELWARIQQQLPPVPPTAAPGAGVPGPLAGWWKAGLLMASAVLIIGLPWLLRWYAPAAPRTSRPAAATARSRRPDTGGPRAAPSRTAAPAASSATGSAPLPAGPTGGIAAAHPPQLAPVLPAPVLPAPAEATELARTQHLVRPAPALGTARLTLTPSSVLPPNPAAAVVPASRGAVVPASVPRASGAAGTPTAGTTAKLTPQSKHHRKGLSSVSPSRPAGYLSLAQEGDNPTAPLANATPGSRAGAVRRTSQESNLPVSVAVAPAAFAAASRSGSTRRNKPTRGIASYPAGAASRGAGLSRQEAAAAPKDRHRQPKDIVRQLPAPSDTAALPATAMLLKGPSAVGSPSERLEVLPLLFLSAPVVREQPGLPVVRPTVAEQGSGRRTASGKGRWDLQLVAGPALSHRRQAAFDTLPASVTSTERAAVGYMAQATLRYRLRPRLALAVGAGYTQYASTVAVTVRTTTTPSPRDTTRVVTVQQFSNRDTYRYLTLPLQLQYLLPGRGRMGLGVLGGTTLGLYEGGQTTGGGTCACQQQAWTSSDSPFRRLDLSLTAGLDVRYYLTPQWAFTAQPTLRYSLLSISSSPAPARYPLAAGLLLGFTYRLP